MKKKESFITCLNKSTRITLFSCVCFVALTCIILVIFIFFPITPSEKIMASIGRENILNGGSGDSPLTAVPGVVTTLTEESKKTTVSTTTGTTTTRTVKINITTGSGFLWNGRIPTGVVSGANIPTTVVEDPVIPTPDPGYNGETQDPQDTGTEENPGEIDIPLIDEPSTGSETSVPVDPNPNGGEIGGEIPVPVVPNPSGGEVGGETPVPVEPEPSGGEIGGETPAPVEPEPSGGETPAPVDPAPVEGGGDTGGEVIDNGEW